MLFNCGKPTLFDNIKHTPKQLLFTCNQAISCLNCRQHTSREVDWCMDLSTSREKMPDRCRQGDDHGDVCTTTSSSATFHAAADAVQVLVQGQDARLASQETQLKLYGLYKQATCGDCTASAPAFYQLKARQKWYTGWSWDGGLSMVFLIGSREGYTIASNCAPGRHGMHWLGCLVIRHSSNT